MVSKIEVKVIDYAVYPDQRIDEVDLETIEMRADLLARICGAWDFGHFPTFATLEGLRGWRDVFDRFPLLDSPAYHALRSLYRWPPLGGGVLLRADFERADYLARRSDSCSEFV